MERNGILSDRTPGVCIMSKQIIALLIGINEYPPGVSNLLGCVRDVENMEALLTTNYTAYRPEIVTLTDEQASRANVLLAFREHLGKAKPGDTIYFHYSGHGSLENAPPEFWDFFPNRQNSTLVLADSRKDGGLDLANKELAILMHELASTQADIVSVVDACHAGSPTRSTNDLLKLRRRQTSKGKRIRELASYLDGYYVQMLKKEGQLTVPNVHSLTLSACGEHQVAYETQTQQGAFSSAFLEALTNPDIHYHDLFINTKIALKQKGIRQDPRIRAALGFNVFNSFLTHKLSKQVSTQKIYFLDGYWQMNQGTIHGLVSDGPEAITLAVYQGNNLAVRLGSGTLQEILPQKSTIHLQGFTPEQKKFYYGVISSLSVVPMPVYITGNQTNQTIIKKALARHASPLIHFSSQKQSSNYYLECNANAYKIFEMHSNQLIQGSNGTAPPGIDHIISSLESMIRWHRLLELQNPAPKLDYQKVEFFYQEHHAGSITKKQSINPTIYTAQSSKFSLKVKKSLKQALYLSLVKLSENFSIEILNNTTMPHEGFMTIQEEGKLTIPVGKNNFEFVQAYLLISCTEFIEDFVLTQKGLKLGTVKTYRGNASKGLASRTKGRHYPSIKNDWFTHLITVKLVKILGALPPATSQILQPHSQAIVTVKGHPDFRANVSFESIRNSIRQESMSALPEALQAMQWQTIDLFAPDTHKLEILSLSQMQQAATVLEGSPLEIILDITLAPGELLLAVTFYGQEVCIIGESQVNIDGKVHLNITRIVPQVQETSVCQICFIKGQKDTLNIAFS